MTTPLTYPAPDVSRATRGRFLPRHNARVIEQDDLLIVEFVAREPWYTAAPRPRRAVPADNSLQRRALMSLVMLLASSASTLYGWGKWLRWV